MKCNDCNIALFLLQIRIRRLQRSLLASTGFKHSGQTVLPTGPYTSSPAAVPHDIGFALRADQQGGNESEKKNTRNIFFNNTYTTSVVKSSFISCDF